MLDSILRTAYNKLKPREKKYQKYARPRNLIGKSAFWVFALIIVALSSIESIFEIPTQFYMGAALLSWLIFYYLSTRLLDKKANIYRLNPDEQALFHTCSILENLENYFDSKNSELRKEYKKNILDSSEELLLTIENNWTLGNFKLAREHFGGSISKLKENIRNRVIPHIKEEDESVLKGIETVMYNFAQLLRNPSVGDLNHINKSIAKRMGSRPSVKIGLLTRCSKFFKAHRVLRHTLVTISLGILCYFVYFFGINYNLASKDVAFATAIGLFGILFVGYLQYTKKEKEILYKL